MPRSATEMRSSPETRRLDARPAVARRVIRRSSPPYFTALPIRFCRHCEIPPRSPMTWGRSASIFTSSVKPRSVHQAFGIGNNGVDDPFHRDGLQDIAVGAILGGGKEQDLVDQVAHAAALVLEDGAVLAHGVPVADEAVGEVVGRRADDGQGSAQLMRDRGDKLHLQMGQLHAAQHPAALDGPPAALESRKVKLKIPTSLYEERREAAARSASRREASSA